MMVSGSELFLGLFNNLAIFIILVAVYGALNSYFGNSEWYIRQSVVGFFFGLFAIGCMYVRIPVAAGVIVDQRNTIVALSGAFGGPLAASFCAVMTGVYRVYLGGAGVLGGVVGVCLAAMAGMVFYRFRQRVDNVFKAFISALAATIIILPGFLFIGDLQFGWSLLKAMALPYGAAIFLGIFLVGFLLAHEEKRHTAGVEQKKSEKRYRELFENLIDVSYRTDGDGNFVVISPSAEKLLGYRPEEVLGKKIADFYRYRERCDDFVSRIRQDGLVENFEAEISKKDGSLVWVSTNAKLLTNGDGSFAGIEGVTRDISPLKKAAQDKLELEESLRQSQKMEAVGTLAGGIAHDFNNILTGIIGYAELTRETIPESSPTSQYINEILQAGLRAKDLVAQILAFSRKSEHNRVPVQLHLVAKEALRLLRASTPSTIRINQDIDADSGAILADPIEIQQVIMNLCANAVQEMAGEGGVLTVNVARVTLSEANLIGEPKIKRGEYVRLVVSDTGHGIVGENVERIFDPYYTTKKIGKGTGLGLSIVHSIVKSHSGMITVESELAKGTTFTVVFPKTADPEQQAAKETGPLPTGNERILVVDDEALVADVTQKRLEQLGYQITSRTSSRAALALFRTKPQAFDLVITDQTMPDMTGVQLARELIALRPDLPIILCTGYSPEIDAEKAESFGIRGFIMKPVDQRELALAIRRVLAQEVV